MPTCNQPQCKFADTGICLEGHKEGCPHLVDSDATRTVITTAEVSTPSSPEIRFHSGEKLTLAEASRILSDRKVQVVFLVGAKSSGKTTFLARLGEKFRDGTFAAHRFACSLTLCAFERFSWLATTNSKGPRPKTPRTHRRENDTFFHLRVRPFDQPREHLDVLLSDLAGETFANAVASREFCSNLRSLARADHLILFLDCEQLVDPGKRHPEISNARSFLQRVTSVRHEPKHLAVTIVFSRWDFIEGSGDKMALKEYCLGIQVNFTATFGNAFRSLEFRRVSVRPDNLAYRTDGELDAMLAQWLTTDASLVPSTPFWTEHPARDFSAFRSL
jgi:hypothetical protein